MSFVPIKEYVEASILALKQRVEALSYVPTFCIIQVNDDPASNSYINGKVKDAQRVGINCVVKKLPVEITEAELFDEIERVNHDNAYHGLIVQMPLPSQINEEAVKLRVNPLKDIDGFHPLSSLEPCTPKGIINYLVRNQYEISGKNAVIIGRSNIVGRPMAKLLLNKSANTTVLHSKTSETDKKYYLQHADLIVCAVGKANFLNDNFIYKKEAVVFDVGINRVDGVLVGDATANLGVAFQSPVPGGVGLLTRLTLLENLLEAIERNKGEN